jgi:hypothetical protein
VKKIILLIAICALFWIVSCASLEIKQSERPDIETIIEFEKILREISQPWEYEKNVFDCTNQTAYLYDYLTQKGYACKIIVGWKLLWKWHAWLIAEKDGKKFLVESVYRISVSPDYFKDCIIRIRFNSLEKAKKVYKLFGSLGEWDY